MSNQTVTTTSDAEYASLGFYHKISYLRSDTWIRLSRLATRMREASTGSGDIETLMEETRNTITMLERIEDYTAFPSKDDFRLLWRLLDDREFSLL